MKFVCHLLGVTFAAGLGLLLGLAWRPTERQLISQTAQPTSEMIPGDSPSRDHVAGRKSAMMRARDDSPLATGLARELSRGSRITRWLYWIEAIEAASLADFPRLAGLAKGDALATKLVASDWVRRDLQDLFRTLSAVPSRRDLPVNELAEAMFLEWARRDPDGAIAALQGTNSFGTREAWRFQVAGYLMEKDPERGLRALSEWGLDNFAPRMTGVATWAAADPRRATEVVLAHPAGYTSELALQTIAKQWVKVDPASAMSFACSKRGELATFLADTVLKSWAAQNMDQAADWVGRAEAATRQRLSPVLAEAWAKADPTNALAWCEANLTGTSLAQTVGHIVDAVAQKDLVAAATLVSGLKTSASRAETAAAVAKHWVPGWRSGQPVPEAAIAWLGGLDAASTKRALEQVEWKWSNGDPKSMAEFLATADDEKITPSADLNVARALARQVPANAFTWAARLPEERSLRAGREAFAEWRRVQPELATAWLNDLPNLNWRRKILAPEETR